MRRHLHVVFGNCQDGPLCVANRRCFGLKAHRLEPFKRYMDATAAYNRDSRRRTNKKPRRASILAPGQRWWGGRGPKLSTLTTSMKKPPLVRANQPRILRDSLTLFITLSKYVSARGHRLGSQGPCEHTNVRMCVGCYLPLQDQRVPREAPDGGAGVELMRGRVQVER